LAKRAPEYGIKLSADIIDTLAEIIPELLAGAPDLEGATQHKRRLTPFTAIDHGGRYIHYGIREHAMGAMMNGMAAHGGVVPVGVTYLVFSDYMRPTLRLAAIMGLPVPFVFSHDSIGIGRNGPTHQPVEYLAALRVIPNMLVLRPADAVEAAECWEIALGHRTGPCSLIFARQPLPPVRADFANENLSCRGAYVLLRPTATRATLLSWLPAPKSPSHSKLACYCKLTACQPRLFRCHAGSCSNSRTTLIAAGSSAKAVSGLQSKPRFDKAGTAILARTASSWA
jgi:transketolase